MKTMKKFFALLLALAMMMAMSVSASAAEADLTGHTYTAYQIFSGTQANGSDSLGNIGWGSGISDDGKIALLKFGKTEGEASYGSVAALAAALNDSNAEAFAEEAYKYIMGEGVAVTAGTDPQPAGYYLIVDTTENLSGKNTVYNLALLQLTKKGALEIRTKVDVPEVEKKVKDTNDSTGVISGWQDSADYDIGDIIPFRLTATMPSTVDGYDTYKVVFHDTLSKGLDFTENSVSVKIGSKDVTDSFSVSEANGVLTISCNDVLTEAVGATANSKIVVEYTAKLTENAEIGAKGNPNEVYLEYSNNPNWNGDGDTEPTGNTPSDKVIVFTYELDANKVAKDDSGELKPLTGAGFTLYKFIPSEAGTDTYGTGDGAVKGNWTAVGIEVKGEAMTTFKWNGIDDGIYKLVETTTPAGYNTMEDIEFTVSAVHDTESADPKLTDLTTTIDGFTATASTGLIAGDIENQKGATLPETGGIGTKIFYIGGSVLLVGAAILLITKKRMGAEE